MCTLTMDKSEVDPKFALFNVVFSSDSNELLTVPSIQDALRKIGIELPEQDIEESFAKWRRIGMLLQLPLGRAQGIVSSLMLTH